MPQCAVTTCKNNHRKTKGRRVRYHRFPAEDDVRSRWVSVCGRGTFNTATARVCSLHFSPHSYERDVEHEMLGLPPRSRLKRGAVPDRAVPITLPSLIGRWKNVRPRQQQVGRAAPRKGRKPASKTPPQLPLDDEDKDDVITGTGIDVLLALGLTPIERRDQDGVHDGLNRMHVMEEEAALDDLPKTNGSPMQCQPNSMPPPGGGGGGGGGSGGQENGTKSEDIKDSKEEHVPMNKEDDGNDKAVPVAIDSKLQLAEEASKVLEPLAESKNQKETVTTSVMKQTEQSESTAKAIVGEEVCSLPPSPPEEEEEEVSAASSPESQEAKLRGRPVSSRKRESSESDSDGTLAKHLKLGMPSSPRREAEERERTVSEYVENAAGTSLEELRKSTEKLQKEIHALDALARVKEHEWNGIIRLKKVKEEVFLRLQRKRQVMLLMMGKTPSDTMDWDLSSDLRYGEYVDTDKVKTSECTTTTTINNIRASVPGRISSKESVPQQQAMATGVSVLKNNNQNNQIPVMMVPIVSSTPTTLPSHLSSSMGSREKTAPRVPHRPILPKPATAVLLGANGTGSGASNNGQNPVIGEGRQGPILDVRSIIADYRSRHPETVPRRGRRLKSSVSPTPAENLVTSTRVVSGAGGGGILSMSSLALGSGSQMRTGVVGTSSDMGELSFLLSEAAASGAIKQDNSRPSSADSSRSGALSITHHGAPETSSGSAVTNISFKDVLVHFAKMSQTEQRQEAPPSVAVTPAITSSPNKAPPPPYPEVTLHPVLAPHSPPSSSLLHGILTKSNHAAAQHRNEALSGRPATFSPTLARLLTAPERIINTTSSSTATSFHGSAAHVSITDLLSTSKTRNEITITPVSSQPHKAKDEVVLVEEEQEDSADRLVIDESGDVDSARGRGEMDDDPGHEMAPEDVPECQGCHQRAAQFVCAGCGNQWYCSRDCQVSAWDEHSEVCSG